MKKEILLIFFVLFKIVVNSQGTPTIIPPSPTAISLANYAYFPPVLSNGTTSTSIPIYNIKSGDLNYPLSLNYHHSGIKSRQDASYVGLGFALEGVGVITRQVNDRPDFTPGMGYYFINDSDYISENDWNRSFFTVNNRIRPINCSQSSSIQDKLIYRLGQKSSSYGGNEPDTEADIFYYNFNGNVGTFYFKRQAEEPSNLDYATPIIQSATPIDIKYYFNDKRWVVVDASGMKYIFSTIEQTMNCNQSTSFLPSLNCETGNTHSVSTNYIVPTDYSDKFISSWYLDRIESPLGNEINFYYDTNIQATESSIIISENHEYVLRDSKLGFNGPMYPEPPTLGFKYNFNASHTVTQDVYLKRIEFENGKIDFETSKRDDLKIYDGFGLSWINPSNHNISPPQKLDRIIVKNTNNRKIVDYKFDYSYFSTDKVNTKKLKLNKILVNTNDNQKGYEKKYKFDYYGNIVPSSTSNAIDHWGYYNGKPLNHKLWSWNPNQLSNFGTLLPDIDIHNYTLNSHLLPTFRRYFFGNNRTPNAEKAVYGTLKSITYPTGGTKSFKYELNSYTERKQKYLTFDYQLNISQKQDGFTTKDLTITIPKDETTVVLDYNSLFRINPERYEPSNNIGLKCFSFPFESFIIVKQGSTNLHYINTNDPNNTSDVGADCNGGISNNNEYNCTRGPSGYWYIRGNRELTLNAGTYTFRVLTKEFSSSFKNEYIDNTNLNIWYQENKGYHNTQLNGGGIRVKEIKNITQNNTITKQYEYTKSNGSTSGVLMSPVKYFSIEDKILTYRSYGILDKLGRCTKNEYILTRGLCSNLVVSAQTPNDRCRTTLYPVDYAFTMIKAKTSGLVDFGSAPKGNSVCYSKVTETVVSNDSSYSTHYWYHAYPNVFRYNYVPGTYNLLNGLPHKIEYKNNLDQTVKKEELLYNHILIDESESIRMLPVSNTLPITLGGGVIKWYKKPSVWVYNTKKTITEYNLNSIITRVNNTIPKTTEVNYFYENPDHLQLTKTETINSKGDKITHKMYYPDDVKNLESLGDDFINLDDFNAIKKLKKNNLHHVSEVVQQETYNNDTLIETSRTNYSDFFTGENSQIVSPLPKSIETLKGEYLWPENPSQSRVTFHRYDNKGNPIEISESNGPHTYFIWGYNKTLPIAKIENFTSADALIIEDLISNVESSSNNDKDDLVFNNNGSTIFPYAGSEGQLRRQLDSIRNHSALSNSLISTYTYNPLIGITSMKDNRGYSTYYQYDKFNRLKLIKDQNNQIIEEYKYNYSD